MKHGWKIAPILFIQVLGMCVMDSVLRLHQLFVSRYQLELPKKEDLERLLEEESSRAGSTS